VPHRPRPGELSIVMYVQAIPDRVRCPLSVNSTHVYSISYEPICLHSDHCSVAHSPAPSSFRKHFGVPLQMHMQCLWCAVVRAGLICTGGRDAHLKAWDFRLGGLAFDLDTLCGSVESMTSLESLGQPNMVLTGKLRHIQPHIVWYAYAAPGTLRTPALVALAY
jgi:hypothetical protein